MKIISALYNKICRLECSCCGDDHFADFSMPNKKLLDENNFLYINFKTAEYRIKDRIRISKSLINRRKQLQNKTEAFNGIITDYNQIAELYSILKLEYEQNDMLKPEDIKNEKRVLELLTSSDGSFHEYSIFTSREGLIVHVTIENSTVYDISISYALSREMKIFEIFKRCFAWIFNKRRNSIFEDQEISLSREEFVDFMNSLNWILQNIEEKKDSEDSPFTHLEIKCK